MDKIDKLLYRAFTGAKYFTVISGAKHLLRAVLDTVGFHCESAGE